MRPRAATQPEEIDRHDCGWRALGFAVIEQAAVDVQRLRAAGGIVNGEPLTPWPQENGPNGYPRGKRLYATYYDPTQVRELLHFLRSDNLDRLLDMLDAPIRAETIRGGLGL